MISSAKTAKGDTKIAVVKADRVVKVFLIVVTSVLKIYCIGIKAGCLGSRTWRGDAGNTELENVDIEYGLGYGPNGEDRKEDDEAD